MGRFVVGWASEQAAQSEYFERPAVKTRKDWH